MPPTKQKRKAVKKKGEYTVLLILHSLCRLRSSATPYYFSLNFVTVSINEKLSLANFS